MAAGTMQNRMETFRVSHCVYVLKDRAGCCANLVTGRERALLFDTGSGIDNIYEAVRRITCLPLIVINSHGHFDHIGGNWQFERVYLHRDDACILESYTPEMLDGWRRELVQGQGGCPAFSVPCLGRGPWENTCILDFDTLDLGGMECRVVPLKGHTRGSVGIWIPKLELLLSGDALTPVMCLIFQNHLPVEEQYHTLEYVHGFQFEFYLTSHHSKTFSHEMIDRLMRCIENSKRGKWHLYRYPSPPYGGGRIYLDSMEDEPVALICE